MALDNHYGVAFHSTVLGGLGVEAAEIERMRDGRPPADDKVAAVYELARQIVLERGRVDDDVIERVRQVGYSQSEVLDIVAECTLAGLGGVVDNLVGRGALDEFLRPRPGGDVMCLTGCGPRFRTSTIAGEHASMRSSATAGGHGLSDGPDRRPR